MIRRIIASSMQLRFVVFAVAALLLIIGFTQLEEMPVDILPEFSRPYVEVQTEALGLSAEEVESLITTPMEADMLNGVSWVDEIRSQSIPGLSSIVLIFEPGTDIMKARQMVQERLVSVYALPNVSKPPAMINPLSSTSRCMAIGLTSNKLSLIEMSVLARWTIVPRLMGVPGVANVSIWGQRKRQLQVQVDPERLRNEDVSLQQIINTTGNALWVSPLSFLNASTPGTGGWIETPNQRLGVRHLLPISKSEDLAQVTIEGTSSKRLGDVAAVVENHQPLIGDAIVTDSPALMLIVERFPWANTIEVTEEVEDALTALRPGLSGLDMDSTLFRPATFLELAIDNLSSALIIGGILIVFVLFAFLFNWRTVLISTLVILISVTSAVTILYLRGVAINMMIIAGLFMALGAVIDDAVVDIENIVRRLGQHRKEGSDKPVANIILEAVAEMRGPTVYATLIIVLVVAPVFFLHGVIGALFQPLVISYVLALIVSMVVALVATPALSLFLLRKPSFREDDPPLAGLVRRIYDSVFSKTVSTPRPVFGAVCVLVVAGLVGMSFLRQDSPLPTFKETDLLIRWEATSGTSHPAMSRLESLVSKELRSVPGVRNVSAHMGRAVLSDRVADINSGQLWVSIDPNANYEKTVTAVQDVVDGYPGLSHEVLTYLQSKVGKGLSDKKKSLVVRVYGEDFNIIRKKAEEVKLSMAAVNGAVDTNIHYPIEEPSIEIEVNLEAAKRYGLKPGDVRRTVTALMGGIEAGYLFEEQKVFDVVVWGASKTRHSMSSIYDLLIETPTGEYVRLKELADVRIVPAVTNIKHESVARYIDVSARVKGRNMAAVAADIKQSIQKVDFPLEYRAELLGKYGKGMADRVGTLAFGIAAAILIFFLLQAVFRKWQLAIVVFFTVPMALVGGLLVVFLTSGGLFSLGSIIGFGLVFSIAVRNTITLIRRYQRMEQYEGDTFGPELIRRATRERCVPIITTAIATCIAVAPAVVFGNIAGLEVVHPMATVILGGLVTSTLFTLVGVPVIFLMFGAGSEPELDLGPVMVPTEEKV
jgi:CzcA family heavy metal efflux pump